MPRTGRRRSLNIAVAIVASLAAPAAAQAATYTVNPGDEACGAPADLVCGGLAQAAAAAVPGDVFNVANGTYASATFSDANVTIVGAPTFTVNGTLTFSAASGTSSKLQKATINQSSAAAAVEVTGAAGLQISDSVVLSAGDGATFAEGTTNKIERSVVATVGQATAGVSVTSSDGSSAAKALLVESSILTGGAAALSVKTGMLGVLSSAGNVAVTLRHVTAAGSSNGLAFNSVAAAGAPLGAAVGNISADVTDSIIQNGTSSTNYGGVPPLLAPNTITATYTRTLMGGFDSDAVFVNPARRNFRLKAGSPAIDAGGFTAGESATDIDGDARPGPVTDQGADEFKAAAPTTPPGPPPATNDGDLPAVVITKPRANQKIKLFTTKTTTVRRSGRRVTRRTTKRTKISFAGTAKDKSGIKGVVLTIEKIASPRSTSGTSAQSSAATTPAAKCRWLNPTKGLVLKSCKKPSIIVAKLGANGAWTYNVKSTIKLSAGTYRVIVAAADNSGAFGNSAPRKDAIHRFTLTPKPKPRPASN